MQIRGGQIKDRNVAATQITTKTITGAEISGDALSSGLAFGSDGKIKVLPWRETMLGTADGTNATFSISFIPETRSLNVFRNGMLQDEADYSVTSTSVVFFTAPTNGDKIFANYLINAIAAWQILQDPSTRSGAAFIDAYGYGWTTGVNYSNYSYLLGDGTLINRSSPVSIYGGHRFKKIFTHISTGWWYNARANYGIDVRGQIFAWGWNGWNYDGQEGYLGTNSVAIASSPVSIARPGSYSKVNFACAIDGATGQAFTWGKCTPYYGIPTYNGDNDIVGGSSPVSIARPGSYRDIVRKKVYTHGYAIDAADNSLWAWGPNSQGQLGDGTITPQSSPVSVLIGPVSKVYFKETHQSYENAYAIDTSGMIWGWGPPNGTLGDNSYVNRSSPVMLARPGSYTQIGFCAFATAAIDGATGHIWTWAAPSVVHPSYNCGQLGNGNDNADSASPVEVLGGRSYTKVIGVCGNVENPTNSTFYAIDGATGMIYSWGANNVGQIGDNSMTFRNSPTPVARVASYSDIMAFGGDRGTESVYAVDGVTSNVYAWGYNGGGDQGAGQLGTGDTINRSSPVLIARQMLP